MSEITTNKIEKMIYVIRGQKVMPDSDLAELLQLKQSIWIGRLNEIASDSPLNSCLNYQRKKLKI